MMEDLFHHAVVLLLVRSAVPDPHTASHVHELGGL